MSYWVYQHSGNLPPDELEEDAFYSAVSEEADDAEGSARVRAPRRPRDRRRAAGASAATSARRGVVMIDSRAGRVLDARAPLDGRRRRVGWITEHAARRLDHLMIGTSLPLLLGPGLHHLEAWNEAVCDGAWGPAAAQVGEKIRRRVDLEHWPAFHRSFEAFCGLLRDVATGARGAPPATITSSRGDVHHAYLAEVASGRHRRELARLAGGLLAVPQPARPPRAARHPRHLDSSRRRASPARWPAPPGVDDPPVRWRLVHPEPWFDNQVATLQLDGRRASFTLDKAVPDGVGRAASSGSSSARCSTRLLGHLRHTHLTGA